MSDAFTSPPVEAESFWAGPVLRDSTYGNDFTDPGLRAVQSRPRRKRIAEKSVRPEFALGSTAADLIFGTGPIKPNGGRESLVAEPRPLWSPAAIPGFAALTEGAAGAARVRDHRADELMDARGVLMGVGAARSASAPTRRPTNLDGGCVAVSPPPQYVRGRALVPTGRDPMEHNFDGTSVHVALRADTAACVEGTRLRRTPPAPSLELTTCMVREVAAARTTPVDRGVRMRRQTPRHVSQGHFLGTSWHLAPSSTPTNDADDPPMTTATPPMPMPTTPPMPTTATAPPVAESGGLAARWRGEAGEGEAGGVGRVDVMRRERRRHGERLDADTGAAEAAVPPGRRPWGNGNGGGGGGGGSGGAPDGAAVASGAARMARAGYSSPLLARREALDGGVANHFFAERAYWPAATSAAASITGGAAAAAAAAAVGAGGTRGGGPSAASNASSAPPQWPSAHRSAHFSAKRGVGAHDASTLGLLSEGEGGGEGGREDVRGRDGTPPPPRTHGAAAGARKQRMLAGEGGADAVLQLHGSPPALALAPSSARAPSPPPRAPSPPPRAPSPSWDRSAADSRPQVADLDGAAEVAWRVRRGGASPRSPGSPDASLRSPSSPAASRRLASRTMYALVSPRPQRRRSSMAATAARAGHLHGGGVAVAMGAAGEFAISGESSGAISGAISGELWSPRGRALDSARTPLDSARSPGGG